jgi:hypothetical protein
MKQQHLQLRPEVEKLQGELVRFNEDAKNRGYAESQSQAW